MADGFTAYTPWFRSSGGETGIRPAFFAHHGGGSNTSHTQNGNAFKIQLNATPDVDSTGDFDEDDKHGKGCMKYSNGDTYEGKLSYHLLF